MGNVHEIVDRAAPGSRVVYVDIDRCKSGCAHATYARERARPIGAGSAGVLVVGVAEDLQDCLMAGRGKGAAG